MKSLAGKVAVVTGAAGGIGLALAELLLAERMKVVLADIEEPALEAAARRLGERGDCLAVHADVSDPASMQRLARRAVEAYGDVHLPCLNAGVTNHSGEPIWVTPGEVCDWLFDVNVSGLLNGIRAFVPRMLEVGLEGHVLTVASAASFMPGGGLYGATKHAAASISESLAIDLRRVAAPIGVTMLCPFLVSTEIVDAARNFPGDAQRLQRTPDAERHLGRMRRLHQQVGVEPLAIAKVAVDAIKRGRFYVSDRPLEPLVDTRRDKICSGEPPEPWGLQAEEAD